MYDEGIVYVFLGYARSMDEVFKRLLTSFKFTPTI